MEQLSKDQELQRANDASRLLSDPLLLDTLRRIESDVMEAWAKCPFDDKNGMMELSRLIKTTRKFRQMFEVYVSDGQYTERQLRDNEEQESLMSRITRRFRSV